MKQIKKTDYLLKIVSGVLFAAIAVYFGAYLYNSLNEPYRTGNAVEYTVRDTISVYGMVIRDEETLLSNYSSVFISAEEGKKISRGGIVGMVYSNDEELERAEHLRELNAQIESLETLKSSGSADAQRADSEIKGRIMNLRNAVQEREFSNLGTYSSEIKALIASTSEDSLGIDAELNALYIEVGRLQSETGKANAVIRATGSGLFSSSMDGYENIGPDTLKNITVADLKSLMDSNRTAPEKAIGKLVFGSKWYYAAVIPSDKAEGFYLGQKMTMIFGKYYSEYLSMKVEYISNSEDGSCAVVFSCSSAMADVLSMRMQSAEIILNEDKGIRIPKKAARVDESGAVYVFVQTGMQAEKKPIEIKYEIGDYYVVSSEKLRAGDIVVVSGKDLYEGKVIG